jgi:trk system potassium uptake protein TrkA
MQVLVIGAGEVGFHTALRLSREGQKVVVVDRDSEAVRRVTDQADLQTIIGQGSSPQVLLQAGIKDAELVIAVTDSDEVNLTACHFASLLSPHCTKVARIRSEDILAFMEERGSQILNVDSAINPEREVARQMMQFISVPAASSVTDFAGGRVKLLGLNLPVTSPLVGKSLAELRTGIDLHFLIAVIERDGSVLIPRGDDVLVGGDLAYVVVQEDKIGQLLELFGMQTKPVRNLVIVGGGIIGRQLAKSARAHDIKTRIIEKNEQLCHDLVEDLRDVIVLNGDGTDLTLLQEENIGAADVFAAVTSHEEDNVLIALLGRKMGAQRTIARVAHMGYVPLVSNLGLDLVISPRFSAVGAILRYLRRGKVLNVTSLRSEDAEVIEVEALETSSLVGRPLAEVKIPSGALIAGLIRNDEVIIPSGFTVVQPGDHLIIFLMRKVLSKIEKLLTVSLEFF